MRTTSFALLPLLFLATYFSVIASAQDEPTYIVQRNANSRPTYFTIHNIAQAQALSKGKGVKVGVIDHLFGVDEHASLYAGGANFRGPEGEDPLHRFSHHGYWLSTTLREIAPEAEIYALNTYSRTETERVDAMVKAIDWAIAHKLDVLTYSAARFKPENRKALDEAVDRATKAGIVIVFIHYPNTNNLLPTWLGPRTGDDEREPDLNVLQYDYNVIRVEEYLEYQKTGTSKRYVPFLSMSSTSPVVAAVVAMMRSLKPDLTPEQCKQILVQTSRPITFEGETAAHAMDAGKAVERVWQMMQTPKKQRE